MKTSTLSRLSGLAAVASGVLLVISELLNLTIDFDNLRFEATTSVWFLQSFGFMLGNVLLLGALVGLYVSQAENAGTLGFAGFLVAFLGTALLVGVAWSDAFSTPALVDEAPQALADGEPPGWLNLGLTLSLGIASLGWLMFASATLQARIYPRVAAILLIVGAALVSFPLPLSTVVFSVAVAWLGFTLLTRGSQALQQPSRVN